MKKGFTLIELLVVITIIGVLATLTLSVGGLMLEKGKTSRAKGEIIAFDTALERYKIDNGDYPDSTTISISNSIYSGDSNTYIGDDVTVTARTSSSRGSISGGSGGHLLFAALMGRRQFNETTTIAYPQYIEVRTSQVSSDGTYFQDPFLHPYGYYYDARSQTGSNNQKSLFNAVDPDLWSTGPVKPSDSAPSSNSNNAQGYATYLKWVKNWPSQVQ